MKKNSKNLSVQSQISQKETTPLSTLTMDELESVHGGRWDGRFTFHGGGRCSFCSVDDYDG